MEEIILQILDALRRGETVDDRALVKLVHAQARRAGGDKRAFAKRRLLPFYQRVKREEPERWARWGITPELEEGLVKVLRMKPRRSASGVATITVITKPWPCSGSCIFCPSDVRMPKSYLADEPACARAEQACFDPYLQVSARLTALSQMGHATDKIELIVLGGTWSDYPAEYQIWFMRELFRALNDDATVGQSGSSACVGFSDESGAAFAPSGSSASPASFGRAAASVSPSASAAPASFDPGAAPASFDPGAAPAPLGPVATEAVQCEVTDGHLSYNQAIAQLYGTSTAWREAARVQCATMDELEREQRRNETARHRVVGLVIETRPDAITPEALVNIRRMGATKIQMGVQSVDQRVLDANGRGIRVAQIERAFSLLRLFGFKIHAHFMVNLLGSTPEADRLDYRRFVAELAFQPDEVKLYPCALIESSRLRGRYEAGEWRPYTEDELVGVLIDDVLATPAYCRVSRMIRDFSSGDIMAGNKKPNLRQMVESRLRARCEQTGESVQEIRFREIATSEVDVRALRLEVVPYETPATSERFLQWVTPEGRIAGFLRLSLPRAAAVEVLASELRAAGFEPPVQPGEAMIREVHVYGMAARVGEEGGAAQHHGLGRKLVERACGLAREAGYERINVISAVGTREYYRHLGFYDHGLYQQCKIRTEGMLHHG
ncbi:elongator complex protein 3 [Enorma shizhengliae]|uniref:tRNA carboxymethyluridine synthase n=1 Tax=Enorma shizhengliae TaxID=2606615 RepID=A0A7K0G8I3_9ACTN|nr:tRNA uridine(34) 5-carboxymethylaminomethyl modification radical SAM/GNAT enzyme Elp3 [Enorma shizhengliae]MRX80127.1 tRNA uridine(34) 5-carboxymethylaminomethyl modification radical SAM/GNAT enzyme Elp3 [Enorma shizhengliae]